jgi:hypothetical protein
VCHPADFDFLDKALVLQIGKQGARPLIIRVHVFVSAEEGGYLGQCYLTLAHHPAQQAALRLGQRKQVARLKPRQWLAGLASAL